MFYFLKVTNVFIPKWKYKYYYNLNEALKKKFTVSIFYGLLLYVNLLIMIYSNCSFIPGYSWGKWHILIPNTSNCCPLPQSIVYKNCWSHVYNGI